MLFSRNGWRDPLCRVHSASSAVALAGLFALQGPAAVIFASDAEAKTPGKTYCFFGFCHRVRTINETKKAIGVDHACALMIPADSMAESGNRLIRD